jgi:glycosyltransferase involved in cell wall biosynthesis
MHSPTIDTSAASTQGIHEREEHGLLILSPANLPATRRILFINVSDGTSAWHKYKAGLIPSNRLWGCVELVRMGYEIGLAESLRDFYFHRNPFPHDLRLLRACREWLRADDIVYCAHNTLYWLPFLKRFRLLRQPVVSLLYAREPLNLGSGHAGIIALNPAAADHARHLAPRAKVAHLGWGMDLDYYPQIPFHSESFLSCGKTNRDFNTLSLAAAGTRTRIRLIGHGDGAHTKFPRNVEVIPGGPGWTTRLTYRELLHSYYANCTASLIVLKPDPVEYTACGFTNLLEAMAVGRPAILTRTNANQSEIDIERSNCGLWVPPKDPIALAHAMNHLAENPGFSQKLGETGRLLCETHYNIKRFGADLHRFFESL